MTLIVFLNSGVGLTFREAAVITNDVNRLIFEYVSSGDGVRRRAVFNQRNVVGISQEVG